MVSRYENYDLSRQNTFRMKVSCACYIEYDSIEDLKSLGALFHVVNDIERIGDHATNIAEWVIFALTGKKEIRQN